MSRGQWKTGIVRRPVTGKDGHVRRALVAHLDAAGKRRESERAVVDLVLLWSDRKSQ